MKDKHVQCDNCGQVNSFNGYECGFKRCLCCKAQIVLDPEYDDQDECDCDYIADMN